MFKLHVKGQFSYFRDTYAYPIIICTNFFFVLSSLMFAHSNLLEIWYIPYIHTYTYTYVHIATLCTRAYHHVKLASYSFIYKYVDQCVSPQNFTITSSSGKADKIYRICLSLPESYEKWGVICNDMPSFCHPSHN